jgi:3-oxoacyl-[acyl-carrier-protein] synthase II
MAMVTPLGRDLKETWENLVRGKSGVGYITRFDASTFATRIAAEVKDFSLDHYILGGSRQYAQAGLNSQFALAAAAMAVADAGLRMGKVDPWRMGVYLGAGEGHQDLPVFMKLLRRASLEGGIQMPVFNRGAMGELSPIRELEQTPNMPAAHVAALLGAQGPNVNCLTACAASAQAVGEAVELIRAGDADVMIAGGSHSMIHPLGVMGFNLLTALSTRNEEPERASRPFDLQRDGFVLGEGSGVVVLEELGHARRRNARQIYGEVVGYGLSADAFRLTDPHEEGRGAVQAMKHALEDAGLEPQAIQYINAHGTSTKEGDAIETLAIKKVFGEYAYRVPISSTKSMMGHLIAAAGVVEFIICLLVIQHGMIPPTINLEYPDPACDLDYVPNEARGATVNVALSNSFGFGGQNACVIVRRYEE